LEYPFQTGGDLLHCLKKAKLNVSIDLHEAIFKILLGDLLTTFETFWEKGFVHGNLCPGSVFLNEQSHLMLGDFEDIVHEFLGVQDMLVLVFYELLSKKERRSKSILSEEEGKGDVSQEQYCGPRDLSSGIHSDFQCLSVEGLKGGLVFAENLVLNLKSYSHFQEENHKIQYFINFFKKTGCIKDETMQEVNQEVPRNSMKPISENNPSIFPRNFSFKKINLWCKQNPKKQNLLRFRYNSGFWKECEDGIPNLEYRAPEYAKQGIMSLASDIWGLGCIMYEIFYQEPLFQFPPDHVDQKNLREFIQSFDVNSSGRGFSKMSKKLREVFKQFLKHCPFERIMCFQKMDIWGDGVLKDLDAAKLREDQFPVKFKYDEQYNYGQNDFFLNSVNYRVSAKFKQKFRNKELKYIRYGQQGVKKLKKKKTKKKTKRKKKMEEIKNIFEHKTKNLNMKKADKQKNKIKSKNLKNKKEKIKTKTQKIKKLNDHRIKIEQKIWKLDKKVLQFKNTKKPKKKQQQNKQKKPKKQDNITVPQTEHTDMFSSVTRRSTTKERYFDLNSNELFSRFHSNTLRSPSQGHLF
jgi:hypothetical protein